MPIWEKNLTVKSNGLERRLIKLWAEKNGDVYIRLFSGDFADMPENKILEHRYSIHPSFKSLDKNLIKKTIRAEKQVKVESVAYTKAIKSKIGFSPIVTIAYSNLSAETYNLPENTLSEILNENLLFNSLNQTYCLSILVGYKGSGFDCDLNAINFFEMSWNDIKVVVISSINPIPPMLGPVFLDKVTLDPSWGETSNRINILEEQMEGKQSIQCIQYHREMSNELIAKRLERIIASVDDLENVKVVESFIKKIPRTTLHVIDSKEYMEVFGSLENRKAFDQYIKNKLRVKYQWY